MGAEGGMENRTGTGGREPLGKKVSGLNLRHKAYLGSLFTVSLAQERAQLPPCTFLIDN